MPVLTLLTNRYVQIAAIVVIVLAALWGYGKHQHSLGYSQAQNERHLADLESFKSESARLQGLSVTIENQLAQLRLTEPKIIERYINVITKNPLPSTCAIDANRMLNINTAIQAANSGKLSKPLPADK
jgi:hypothetical protein